MSMLHVHAEAVANISEGYHNFLLRFNRTEKVVFGFVEGKEDPSFYRGVIERFLPDDWSVDLIRAGNRSKVLSTEAEFDWSRFSKKQVTFFVDRDLTDFITADTEYPNNVYVTDDYSIENAVVTSDVMLRLLGEVHNVVDWSQEEREGLIQRFTQQVEAFGAFMRPVMAQILHWRLSGVAANLNNVDLSSMFKFEDGEIRAKNEYPSDEDRLDRVCESVGAPRSSPLELSNATMALDSVGQSPRFVRGKYLIWFLSGIVNSLHGSIQNFVAAYSRPPKSRMTFGASNLMVVAAPRARIPGSLRLFIEQNYLEFIDNRDAASLP